MGSILSTGKLSTMKHYEISSFVGFATVEDWWEQ
jgi:hypothetical protein